MNPMIREMLTSALIRVLGFGGTWLVTNGYLEDAEAKQYVVGLAAMIVSFGYGLYKAYTSRQKIVTGLASPRGTTEAQLERTIKAGDAASVLTPKTQAPRL